MKVSYIILSYNQENYISFALNSALKQSYENIEFIIGDDASKDRTPEIIEKIIKKSDRNISYIKRKENVGLAQNVNDLISRSTGDIIILAAGDDISKHDRVKTTVDEFIKNPDVDSMSFNADIINNVGENIGVFSDVTQQKSITLQSFKHNDFSEICGATRAMRRKVFFKFGELMGDTPTEDTTFTFRALLLGTHIISNKKVISYRRHEDNISSKSNLVNFNIDSICRQYTSDLDKVSASLDKASLDKAYSWIEFNFYFRKWKANKLELQLLFPILINRFFVEKFRGLLCKKF